MTLGKLHFDMKRIDLVAALLVGVLLLAGTAYVYQSRYGWLTPTLGNVLFWDAQVLSSAGRLIADGKDAYEGLMRSEPFTLPFISAPQVAMLLAGMWKLMGPLMLVPMAIGHIAAMTFVPYFMARAFIGKSWQEIVLGYGIFFCGLNAVAMTTVLAGNLGSTCYLAIFAGMIPGLKSGRWFWFYVACGVAAQLKPPYALMMAIPVMVNGLSWREARNAAITAVIAAVPFVIAYLVSPPYFDAWLQSLDRQVTVEVDDGLSIYSAVARLTDDTLAPLAAHLFVVALLFVFLVNDRTRGMMRIAAVIAFAIFLNPRLKEYDLVFTVIPVMALYLNAAAGQHATLLRRALAMGVIPLITLVSLKADLLPEIEPFVLAILIAGGILLLGAPDRKHASPTTMLPAE
jgi:hypothetical protein